VTKRIQQAREEHRVQLLTMMLLGEIYKLCDITRVLLDYEPAYCDESVL